MLEIFLLGARAVVDGTTGEVRSRSSRTLALVAYLARQANTPQPRSRIAADFWPASTEGQAHTNLRREIHQLRAVLGDDASLQVTTTDLTWCDTANARVDLRSFRVSRDRALAARRNDDAVIEHGAVALRAFAGELLPGVFDEWVLAERERLSAECVELCAAVTEVADRAGRVEMALAAARRRVELAPFEETGHRALIRLHARRGDRAAAVSAYHRCAQLLDQELGVEPDAETKKLLAALLRAPAARPDRPRVVPPAIRAVGLVARRAELAALGTALTTAFAGSARVVLLTGEPGVGKSRLAAETARAARRADAVVATARCYGTPGRTALAPVAEWLSEPVLSATVAALEPPWQAEVARLVPLPRAPSAEDGAQATVDPWQRPRFYQALLRALRPEDRPLLLVLDDLQWCDAATLDLLDLLLGTGPSAPLLVVITARAADLRASRDHGEWVRRWRAAGVLREVGVEPLDAADTGELLRRLTGDTVPPEVADAVVSTTGGFPLYVVEAARRGGGLDVGGLRTGRLSTCGFRPDLGAVLEERLGQLNDRTAGVAGLAAAVGRPFDLELVCEASDLDADAVVQAVDELWRLRIVRETARGYDFTHDLLRAAAYERVNPPQRWLLHRRLAQALEVVWAGRTDQVAAQLAEQYSRAGNARRALESYHRAAEMAARVFAHGEALGLHRAALGQLERLPAGPDRDLLEVRTLTSMSASLNALKGYADPDLSAALERTVALAERLSLRETLVDALVGLWGSWFVRGDMGASRDIARRAVTIADAAPDARALSGQAHFALAGASFALGDLGVARTHIDLAIDRSSDDQMLSIGSHAAIHARAWSAHIAWLLGDTERTLACAADAVDRARALGQPYSLAIALAYAAVTWQLTGERERLVGAADELQRLSARHGFAYYPAWSLVLGGWAADDAAGTARLERGIADLRATGSFARMPYWLSLLAERCPDQDRSRSVLDAAVVAARARKDRWWLPELLRRRAPREPAGSTVAALEDALAVALEQGSVTLAERCRRDLAAARTPGERAPS